MSAHRLTEFLPSPLREGEEAASQEWLKACAWISEIISLVREQALAGRRRRLPVVPWTEGTQAEIPIVGCFLKGAGSGGEQWGGTGHKPVPHPHPSGS